VKLNVAKMLFTPIKLKAMSIW